MSGFDTFRKRLDSLLKNSEKTILQQANEMGLASATLSRYMQGTRIPEIQSLVRLSIYFNVSIDWLIGLSDERTNYLSQDVYYFANLYSVSSESDKAVIRTILQKYRK